MNEQIVIGKLKDPYTISAAMFAKTAQEWDHRAMWSYLRLQYGRKKADTTITDHFDMIETMKDRKLKKDERNAEMKLLFADLVRVQTKPRKMQFIFDEEQKVMAVASLKHLLIPPEEVYGIASSILAVNYGKPEPITIPELVGITFTVKEILGMKFGLQVYGGTITTRQAITITSWLRVHLCLNSLSWLGIGSFSSLGISGRNYEKILRIKVKADLEPRIRSGIEQGLKRIGNIEQRVHVVEKVKVRQKEAKILLSAMGISYGLGAKTIRQVLSRFEKEPKNQWGLSMASSWVAAHGTLKKTPIHQKRNVEQKLSTIAGATLLIDDIKKAKETSLGWLKSHVKEGRVKSIDELIGDLI